MALFKIEKGLAANLTTNRPTTNEGYCYFTSDDGKFYIDIATGSDLTKRICLNAYKADQWKNAININGMSIDGTTNRFNYGTCGTATNNAAKTVSCAGYVLATGSEIAVKFTYANIATNPTLNVNNTGAKLIKYKGSSVPTGFIEAGGTYVFRYDGSYYNIVGNIVLVDSVLDTSSTHAVQNKVVTEALNQKANKTNGIYYIEGNTEGTAGTWTGTCSDITEYYDGLIISYKIGIAGASTTTLNINELGAKQVYLNNNTSLTTHYPVGSALVLTYTDGYWKIANYDSNSKVTQTSTTANANYHLLLAYSTNIKTSTASTARKNASLYYNPSTGLLTAPTFVGTLSGNASTATSAAAFTSAQTVSLTGDVTGSAASVGGWTISTTLKSTGVAAGAYGLASKTSPAFGSSFNVPYITVDAQGRITSAATCTVQLPANPNTDSKVTNTASSTATFYITGTTSSTTNTGGQVFNPAISISGNTIIATNFSGSLSGKATTADSATVAASLATSTAGSATKPVYFSAGKPVACTYTISANVPSNAKFTDTTYTAGTGLSLSSGVFKHSNSVAARTSYTQSTASSPGYAGTFKVYEPIYDEQGHITGLQAETITMPSAQTMADLGITGAMIYKGISTEEIQDGGTQAPTIGGTSIATSTLQAGNVVLYSDKEFVWNGSAWELLGDEGSYKVKQSAVSSPSASGNTTSFIDTISQDANGKITATKKTVSNATTSAAGLMSAADKTKLNGIATGANNYTLPTASDSTLGGVKIGSNINISDGTISVANASGTVKGVTIVYPADSCTTFSSDSGTITPLAVQKGAKLFSYERLTDTAVTETAIPRFKKSAVTINGVKYSGLENTNITIQSVTNSANSNSASVLCIPAEGGKKMVYGYCTDQVDGTSFIGGVFDADATAFPYAAGLAIGGTSGNLLWKGKRVLTTDDSYTHPTSAGNKHIPSGGSSGQILRWSASGTATWGADNNTTYTIATGDSNGQIKVTPSSGSAYNVSVKGLGSAAYTASTAYAEASHTHNYAGSSSAGGAATSANKVNKDLIIKFNGGSTEGTNLFTFNGSAAKTLNITASSIGAAETSHSHNYAGSSSQGGSATKVAVSNTTPTSATSYFLHYSAGNSGDQSVLANNDLYYYDTGTSSYLAVGSSSNMGGLTLQKGNSYCANIVPGDLTANRTLTIPNVSGTIITSANLPNYAGSSSVGGAATSANKVNSSLTIKLNNGSTEGTNLFTFNGSAAKTVNITPSSIKAAALESGNTFVSTNQFNQQTTFKGTILLDSATYGTAVPSSFSNNQVFFVEDNGDSVPSGGSTGDVLIKQSNGKAAWGQNIADGINAYATTSRINVAGIAGTGVYYNSNVFIENNVLMGAAWNDYAEYRICNDDYKPGQVICENGDDTLSISKDRMQPGAEIISDTFGMVIGETEKAKCPVAISGRVLAYTFEPREQFKAGDAVCAGPNGTVSKMTREEIREYPDRIIGTVSAIPDYKIWNEKVVVDDRIWIKVK